MLVRETPPPALTAALAKFAAKPSSEALAVIAEHAEAGWPEAQTALGLHHAKGDVVQRDFKKALELFGKAAAQDDAEAQYYFGYAYLSGSGVAADPVTALAWFIVAASRGHAEAVTERDRGLASLSKQDRSRAINMSGNLPSEVAAGWSRDPANGTAVWLPSWFRNGSYALRVEVPAEDGYAHGIGKIVLKSSEAGSSDRTFEGRFFRGVLHGARAREEELHFLPTDDFLFRLPDSPHRDFKGIVYWLRVDYGVEIAADPCYAAINRHPDILGAVADGFPVLDDAVLEKTMREGWRLYTELCPAHVQADVYVVPSAFRQQRRGSNRRWEFVPRIASANIYGQRGEEVSFGQFENAARRAHERAQQEAERQRERAAREEKRRRDEAAAKTRGSPDVRGLRLGMTLTEIRELFRDEIVEWNPPWRPDKPPPAYKQFEQRFRLADGASVDASFTSSVHGTVLFAFSYEQNFRDGVEAEKLEADLKTKYGEPDDTRGGGRYWTYTLVSRQPEEVLGAFLKVTLRDMEAPGKVSFLRLVVNDAGFGSYDERAAYAAEREAKRKAFEASKSERPKF